MLKHLPLLDPKIDKLIILGVGRFDNCLNLDGFKSLPSKENGQQAYRDSADATAGEMRKLLWRSVACCCRSVELG